MKVMLHGQGIPFEILTFSGLPFHNELADGFQDGFRRKCLVSARKYLIHCRRESLFIIRKISGPKRNILRQELSTDSKRQDMTDKLRNMAEKRIIFPEQ